MDLWLELFYFISVKIITTENMIETNELQLECNAIANQNFFYLKRPLHFINTHSNFSISNIHSIFETEIYREVL